MIDYDKLYIRWWNNYNGAVFNSSTGEFIRKGPIKEEKTTMNAKLAFLKAEFALKEKKLELARKELREAEYSLNATHQVWDLPCLLDTIKNAADQGQFIVEVPKMSKLYDYLPTLNGLFDAGFKVDERVNAFYISWQVSNPLN